MSSNWNHQAIERFTWFPPLTDGSVAFLSSKPRLRGDVSMDWFSWENLHRKPWIFPVNVGFSCKFPAKTNPLNVRKKSGRWNWPNYGLFMVVTGGNNPLTPLVDSWKLVRSIKHEGKESDPKLAMHAVCYGDKPKKIWGWPLLQLLNQHLATSLVVSKTWTQIHHTPW